MKFYDVKVTFIEIFHFNTGFAFFVKKSKFQFNICCVCASKIVVPKRVKLLHREEFHYFTEGICAFNTFALHQLNSV